MAHMLFDALNGVSLDNHTVQSILDSTTLTSAGPPTTITLDEEDVFQCGKCKKQFTSFSLFMCHKKEHTAGDHFQESDVAESTSFQQLEVQALDNSISASELCQPIILSEADILSFSIDDEDPLNIHASAQIISSAPNVPDGSLFVATNIESGGMKQLGDTSSGTSSFDGTGQPIILTSQSQQFPSGLPCIQSQGKLSSCPGITCGKDASQNINILATCSERTPKGCKVLLPNIDYIEENDNGSLLLECDEASDKLMQYGNGTVESDGTVLLDYCDGEARKTCKVLLSNGEYTETSIEYIDNTTDFCEYSNITGVCENGTEVEQETVSVSFLDVINSSNGSVTLDISKAINEVVDTAQISVHDTRLSIDITNQHNPAVTEVDSLSRDVCQNLGRDYGSGDQLTDRKDNSRSSTVKTPKLKCHFCNKMFAKNFDLQQHLRSHTGEKPFQCVVCGRAFSQKSNVKKHMATHKVWPDGFSRTLPKEPLQILEKSPTSEACKPKKERGDDGENIIIIDRSYVCQYCNTSFTSYFELKTHMKKHSHQKVYKCVQHNCQQTFEDLDSFLKHTKVHTDEIQYCCHVCFKKFNTLADLGMHQYTHNTRNEIKNTRYFLCMKCKSKFTSLKALDIHLSTTNHHFPCAHCGKVFTCERYLRRHLPTHGTPERFVCPTCGKGFRTEQYLNTHRLIHSGMKPYTCMHCPAAFNRKDKLARHSLIHQSVKPFKCPFQSYLGCSKEFNRQDKLKVHILTHSAVKPFHCRKCSKMFHKQSLLKEHERTHHAADAPFSCAQCGLRFKKKVHLSTHVCDPSEVPVEQNTYHEKSCETIPRENVSGKQARGRRFRKIRCKPLSSLSKEVDNIAGQKESTRVVAPVVNNAGSSGENEIDGVPTIEIIVVPMTVQRNEKEEKNGVYHVTFPSSPNGSEMQTKSVQSNVSNALNNSFKHVPDGQSGQSLMACIDALDEEITVDVVA